MIILDVEKYCHECPEFEATVESYSVHYANGTVDKCRHMVYCKHRDRCQAIKTYLEKENKKCVD